MPSQGVTSPIVHGDPAVQVACDDGVVKVGAGNGPNVGVVDHSLHPFPADVRDRDQVPGNYEISQSLQILLLITFCFHISISTYRVIHHFTILADSAIRDDVRILLYCCKFDSSFLQGDHSGLTPGLH